jgi:hypothetical protein
MKTVGGVRRTPRTFHPPPCPEDVRRTRPPYLRSQARFGPRIKITLWLSVARRFVLRSNPLAVAASRSPGCGNG